MNLFDKYYNKWFMSKDPQKIWRNEDKPYKLEVRMLEKNALNEYTDVDMFGEHTFQRKEVCKIVMDSEVLSVVGKLQEAA